MKKTLILLFTILLLYPLTTLALVTKSSDIYLTDEANILEEDTKNYILTYSAYLKESKDIDYYVVTINSLENIDSKEYADYIYQSFNMNENGILILLAKKERTINIKTGSELGEMIPNKTIDEYIDSYFMPYLKNAEWDNGIKNGYSAFYKLICNYYDIDSSSMEVHTGKDILTKYKFPIILFIIWLCTTTGYIFCKSFKKLFNHQPLNLIDFIIFGVSLFINIIALSIAYQIMAISIVLILAFEIVTILGSFDYTSPPKKASKKKKRKRKH